MTESCCSGGVLCGRRIEFRNLLLARRLWLSRV